MAHGPASSAVTPVPYRRARSLFYGHVRHALRLMATVVPRKHDRLA